MMLRGPYIAKWCWRPTAAWFPWVSETALYRSGASADFLVHIWRIFRCTVPAHEELSCSPLSDETSHVLPNCTVSHLGFVLLPRTWLKMERLNQFRAYT
jgi:hypothetical protein